MGWIFGFLMVISGRTWAAELNRIQYRELPHQSHRCAELLAPRASLTQWQRILAQEWGGAFLRADDRPLFSVQQIAEIRTLFDQIDSGELGGFGFSAEDPIQFRKTPYLFLEAKLQGSRVKQVRVLRSEEITHWEQLGIDLSALKDWIQTVMDRALEWKNSPARALFAASKVRIAVSFLRYEVSPNRRYSGFPWHFDRGPFQVITPVSLPEDLQGAALQVRARGRSYWRSPSRWVAHIPSQVNRPVFFENSKFWHRVTPFEWNPPKGSPPRVGFRDVFTLEFYPTDHSGPRSGWFGSEAR